MIDKIKAAKNEEDFKLVQKEQKEAFEKEASNRIIAYTRAKQQAMLKATMKG
jgi:hypothetical protein